jgi:parallel beta-helix repeat protein
LIRAGIHTLTQGIHVNRSNIAITGEPGTILKLAGGVNQPVMLLGSAAETPLVTIYNVRIANLEIDGSKTVQTSEIDPTRPWIRNNGIDVRSVNGLWITGVNVHDARSGGFVASWGSSNIFVTNSLFNSNYFDGIALYASRAITIANFQCSGNGAAGMSLDNKLSDVQFVTGRIENNKDVGIFTRDSADLSFSNLVIARNGSHGCFLSHNQVGNNSGVSRFFFSGSSFLENIGYGLWLASPITESPKNVVSTSLFSGNTLDAINLSPGAVLTQSGNILQ